MDLEPNDGVDNAGEKSSSEETRDFYLLIEGEEERRGVTCLYGKV